MEICRVEDKVSVEMKPDLYLYHVRKIALCAVSLDVGLAIIHLKKGKQNSHVFSNNHFIKESP